MTPRSTILAASLALLFSLSVHSEAADKLGPVVVTATRVEQKLADVIPSASVITREDIDRARAPTLIDLLQGQPGIEIGRNGGPGTQSSLFMRGQSSTSVAVYIDGVRVQTDPYGVLKLVDIPPSQIEKIEILRGNMGALYGEAATGGVIHVFTRAGAAVAGPTASVSYGSRNTSDASFGYNARTNDLRIGLSAQRFETDGYSAMNPRQNANVNPDRDRSQRESFFLTAEKQASSNLAFGLLANAIESRVDYDSDYDTRTDTHRSRTSTSDVTLYGKFQPMRDWSSRLALTQSTFRYLDDKNGARLAFGGESVGNQASAQWSNTVRLGPGNASFGIDATDADFESYGAKYDRRSSGYHLGYSGRTGNLDYQANARHDRIDAKSSASSRSNSTDTWLLGAGYFLTDDVKLIGLYSTSFRAPNTAELFGYYGNPSLAPEVHKGYEVGFSVDSAAGPIRLVRFDTETRNAIAYGADYKPYNIGKSDNSGYELGLNGSASGWSYRVDVVRQDPRDGATGERLARRAREYGSLDLRRSLFDIEWGTRVIVSGNRVDIGSQTLDPYTVVHLFASKRIAPEWTVRARLENAFGKGYQLAHGYDAPPRGVFVSIDYQPR